jgi:hypothetical protein
MIKIQNMTYKQFFFLIYLSQVRLMVNQIKTLKISNLYFNIVKLISVFKLNKNQICNVM